MVIVPIFINIAFTKTRYVASHSSLVVSNLCLGSFLLKYEEGKWRNEAKKIFKWKGDICVISLSSRFIVVLLLRLSFEKKKIESVNFSIDHVVILPLYCVVKEKCVIRLVASQVARLKCSIKTLTSRVRISTSPVLMKSWNILFSAIKHTHKETRKRKKGEKTFSNLFIK